MGKWKRRSDHVKQEMEDQVNDDEQHDDAADASDIHAFLS
jgi:hypothetical protein